MSAAQFGVHYVIIVLNSVQPINDVPVELSISSPDVRGWAIRLRSAPGGKSTPNHYQHNPSQNQTPLPGGQACKTRRVIMQT